MKTALVISSCVAASHVGATASAFCLRRLGHRVLTIPTTILGRHPGWGAPGGQVLETAHLASIWSAIKAQNITIDAVMTGYMGDEGHVSLAAEIIKDVKAANPAAFILVDPVMGDNGQLYIPQPRAQAIQQSLLPLAGIVTPNIWELSYLTARAVESAEQVQKAIGELPCDSLVTSVSQNGKIGAMLSRSSESCAVYHDQFKTVPHGGGDALAATFLAHILHGQSHERALAQSTASIFEILSTPSATGELALIKAQDALISAKPLPLDILDII